MDARDLSLEQQINLARKFKDIPELRRLLKMRETRPITQQPVVNNCTNPVDPFTHVNVSEIKDVFIVNDSENTELRWCFDVIPLARHIFNKPDAPDNPYTTQPFTESQVHEILYKAENLVFPNVISNIVDLENYRKVPFSVCEKELFEQLYALNTRIQITITEKDLVQLYEIQKWLHVNFINSLNKCGVSTKYPKLLISISHQLSDYINSLFSGTNL